MEPLRTIFVVAFAVTAVLTVAVAALPWLLRKRGVEMRRTRFGLTLIFDSTDADGTPVRLLNVNGTFQSVTYVPQEFRFALACVYHRVMADIIKAQVKDRAGEKGTGSADAAGASTADAAGPSTAHAAGTSTSRQTQGRVRVMVMGGGGYSLPKYLAAFVPGVRTDVVEIDPAITKIAREKFFLTECVEQTRACSQGRLQLVNDDAWAFLRAADEPYDVIVNDAFSGKRPLGPMKTAEGARVVREHLAGNGIYLANLRCALEGGGSHVINEVSDAFGREFAHVWLVPEWDDPKKPGCNVLVASNAQVGGLPATARALR